MTLDPRIIGAQRYMAKAASDLHYYADLIVTELDGKPILEEDGAAGDEARAAHENARAWRALVEEGR